MKKPVNLKERPKSKIFQGKNSTVNILKPKLEGK